MLYQCLFAAFRSYGGSELSDKGLLESVLDDEYTTARTTDTFECLYSGNESPKATIIG